MPMLSHGRPCTQILTRGCKRNFEARTRSGGAVIHICCNNALDWIAIMFCAISMLFVCISCLSLNVGAHAFHDGFAILIRDMFGWFRTHFSIYSASTQLHSVCQHCNVFSTFQPCIVVGTFFTEQSHCCWHMFINIRCCFGPDGCQLPHFGVGPPWESPPATTPTGVVRQQCSGPEQCNGHDASFHCKDRPGVQCREHCSASGQVKGCGQGRKPVAQCKLQCQCKLGPLPRHCRCHCTRAAKEAGLQEAARPARQCTAMHC
jgi:hypothetical protein